MGEDPARGAVSRRPKGWGTEAPPPCCPAPPSSSLLFPVLHFRVLRVDNIAVVLLLARSPGAAGSPRALSTLGLLLRLLLGIHLLRELVRGLRARLGLCLDRRLVLALQRLLGFLQRLLDLRLLVGAQLVAVVLERFPDTVNDVVALVLRFHQLARLAIFLGVRLGVLHHALDLFLAEPRARLDLDLVLLARRLVLRGDV